jgi:hypothetical protein
MMEVVSLESLRLLYPKTAVVKGRRDRAGH